IDHPSANSGGFGKSPGFPSGAPPSTQAAIVSMSACCRLTSFEYLPTVGSAPHGGIWRATTFCLIARAHGRASSNAMSDIGAIAVGRWHSTQFLYRIGATSLLKVGVPPNAGAAIENPRTTSATLMSPPERLHRPTVRINPGV